MEAVIEVIGHGVSLIVSLVLGGVRLLFEHGFLVAGIGVIATFVLTWYAKRQSS